ncbi:ABC transporter permease [Qaidamihabitans albus]|uniref:ABC transporter permease n=1 Tax=Qaidamihabitans albus TaxID=2795733 RepID=UPI0018F1E874|nr:ABC transporter permease [Qaidamihabitans albus]
MSRARDRRVLLTRTLVIAAALALLEIAPRAGMVDALTLVPLSDMVVTLGGGIGSGEMLPHLFSTGAMILGSFVLAGVSGVVIGYLLWRYTGLRRALDPYLTSYYALPVFAFYPVLVAIFGLNRTPVVLLAWAYASVAVITNAAIGFDSVHTVHLKTARVYQLSAWQTLRRVQLPAAAPHVFAGLKLAVTYSVIGVIASEFILATQGLGWLVSFNYNSFALAEMYASILLVMAVAVLVTSAVSLLERRLWPKERQA